MYFQASYPVHQMLFAVSNGLNRISPLLTPEHISKLQRSVRTMSSSSVACDNIGMIVCDTYDNMSRLVRKSMSSKLVKYYKNDLYKLVGGSKATNVMIQIIYDIKFLAALINTSDETSSFSSISVHASNTRSAFEQTLLHPNENDVTVEVILDAVSLYEQNVDPFDYDVYSQHISEKMSQEVSQSQHVYGYLLGLSPYLSKTMASSANTNTVSSMSKSTNYHNLCMLVSTPIKYQPLSLPTSAAQFGMKRNSNLNLQSSNVLGQQSPSSARSASPAPAPAPAPATERTSIAGSTGSSLLKGWLTSK